MGRPSQLHIFLEDHQIKRCRTCGQEKTGSEFYRQDKRLDGRVSDCRSCSVEKSLAWRRNNPERRAESRGRHRESTSHYNRQVKYGITAEQFMSMVEEQGGVCALCHKPPKSGPLCVDHDHLTGVIRGLLCSGCNAGLGKLGDDIEGLQRAIAYLRRTLPHGRN